jgi:predicted enzyme related to lactoylglutathione lyase
MLRGLSTVVYHADDLPAARAWYGQLLGLEPYFNRPEYIEFRLGDYQHELGILDRKFQHLLGGAAGAGVPSPAGVVAYWHVDDVPATLERLVALGATVYQPPRDFGEGFIGAAVLDPFGNILGLMYNPHYLAVLNADR